MKKSNLLFKSSLLNKLKAALFALGILPLISCQGPFFFSGAVPLHLFGGQEPIQLGAQSNEKFIKFATIPAEACTKDDNFLLNLEVRSQIGLHPITLAKFSDETKAKIESANLSIPTPFPIDSASFKNFCMSDSTKALLNDNQIENLTSTISFLAPSCDFSLPNTDRTWACELDEPEAPESINHIVKLHRDLVKKFRRHPYLLARRISITYKLASALSSSNKLTTIQNTCRIIKSSLREELPIVLSNPHWQKATCGSLDREGIISSAQFGLKFSIDEVSKSLKLMGKESFRGTLSLKFPKKDIPNRDLWVSLSPKQLNGFTKSGLIENQCWHPLMHDHESYLKAASLGFLKDSSGCTPITTAQDKKRTTEFLFSSISSESQFVISNGRSKILRLPEGKYEYSILNNQNRTVKSSDQHSKGTITWSRKRPHPQLKQW